MANSEGPSSPADPFPFESIGPYRLFSSLGKGGMGMVYLAQHQFLRKFYAVKIMNPKHRGDEKVVERFRQEMQVIGQLHHPNIIEAHNADEQAGYLFLVMDYVPGPDLSKVIRDHSSIGYPEACEIARQTAAGLQCIHEAELVHRDIKPSNLLLGMDGIVRILDLGLARVRALPDEIPLTDTNQIMGTGDFIAPEQGINTRDVDIRADIYSLGCTLYTLLTGFPPFAGIHSRDFKAKIRAHRDLIVPPIQEHRSDLPPALIEVINRLLEKNPAHRYQTPKEVVEALTPFTTQHRLNELISTVAGEETETSLPNRTPAEQYESTPYPLQPPGNVGPEMVSTRTEAPSGPTERLPRMSRRMWLIAPAFGVITLLGFAFSFFGTTLFHFPAPAAEHVENYKIGEWNDLLAREPIGKMWSDDLKACSMTYDPKARVVAIRCSPRSMVELGRIGDTPYELEMEFKQVRWTGGFGIYFRHYKDAKIGNVAPQADMIMLANFLGTEPISPVRLERGQLRDFDGNDRPAHFWILTERIPRPEVKFRWYLRVGPEGLEEMRIDGVPTAAGILDPNPKLLNRPSPRGGVGIYMQATELTVLSARIRPYDPKEFARE